MKRILPAVAVIFLPGFFLWLSLYVLHSLLMTGILYYGLVCLALPLSDLLLLRRLPPGGVPDALGLSRPGRKDVLLGLGAGLAICIFMAASFLAFGGFLMDGNRILPSLEAWGISERNIALALLVMLVLNGVVEEIFWRGYAQGLFAFVKNRPLAVLLPSCVFGLQHFLMVSSFFPRIPALLLFISGITAGGILWGFLREWRKSLWPSLLSHALTTLGYLSLFAFFLAR